MRLRCLKHAPSVICYSLAIQQIFELFLHAGLNSVLKEHVAVNLFAKLGAVMYVLWGLLHLQAARLVYMLGNSLEAGMVQGRIYQVAFYLLFFALFGIAVAVTLNWKNSRLGYWLNLVVVSAADIGFIIYVLLPGYVPLVPGGLGPLLWVLALVFSTLGILQAKSATAGD